MTAYQYTVLSWDSTDILININSAIFRHKKTEHTDATCIKMSSETHMKLWRWFNSFSIRNEYRNKFQRNDEISTLKVIHNNNVPTNTFVIGEM